MQDTTSAFYFFIVFVDELNLPPAEWLLAIPRHHRFPASFPVLMGLHLREDGCVQSSGSSHAGVLHELVGLIEPTSSRWRPNPL